ncbi:hypothetical protein N0V90_006522 [Kalmusia sp. IMI 367209]|nr:hypothetical protein N0V90_006522 [Kalmusia sp. IMI 367209]
MARLSCLPYPRIELLNVVSSFLSHVLEQYKSFLPYNYLLTLYKPLEVKEHSLKFDFMSTAESSKAGGQEPKWESRHNMEEKALYNSDVEKVVTPNLETPVTTFKCHEFATIQGEEYVCTTGLEPIDTRVAPHDWDQYSHHHWYRSYKVYPSRNKKGLKFPLDNDKEFGIIARLDKFEVNKALLYHLSCDERMELRSMHPRYEEETIKAADTYNEDCGLNRIAAQLWNWILEGKTSKQPGQEPRVPCRYQADPEDEDSWRDRGILLNPEWEGKDNWMTQKEQQTPDTWPKLSDHASGST